VIDQPPVAVFRCIHVRSLVTKRLVVESADFKLVVVTVNLTDYVW
jgi:hypothetical protein